MGILVTFTTDEQLYEVLNCFSLHNHLKPFTRCIDCNGLIHKADKVAVMDNLAANIATQFETFYQCDQCKKVYWKGSHYIKMLHFIDCLNQKIKS